MAYAGNRKKNTRSNKTEIGREGENIAIKYLEKLGYLIIAKNWYCRWGEIDIIARNAEGIKFIEVKYRRSDTFGAGFESITRRKKKALQRCVMFYLEQGPPIKTWDFEVIDIYYVQPGKLSLRHYKSVSLFD